jgi:ribonuclease-3 family protein
VAGDSVVPPPPSLHGKGARKSWNSLALAFLGDGVWEVRHRATAAGAVHRAAPPSLASPPTAPRPLQMYVRRRFFYPPVRMSDYYAAVVRNVRAEAQATAYASLLEGGFLSAEERDVLRWGRNATGTTPKRMDGGAMRKETYRAATAVETLVRRGGGLPLGLE